MKLDQSGQRKFCLDRTDGEAWSLAVGTGDITYLRRIGNLCKLILNNTHGLFKHCLVNQ